MLKDLIKHLQVPRKFIQHIGINPSILLSELLNKERYLIQENKISEDRYFFHEYKYIYKNTGLLKVKYTSARKKLENLGIIQTKYGEKKKILFFINEDSLQKVFFPDSHCGISGEDVLELILSEGYIFYPSVLAHKIGINETIFIKSLLSKRNAFLAKGKLQNGYFFNAVSNIKLDTSLSRDQQLKCIKNLCEIQLLDVQYSKDNTRYFCINIDLLSKFESLEINTLVSFSKSTDQKLKNNIDFVNPFSSEVTKHDETKVIKHDETEIIKNYNKKSYSSTSRSDDSSRVDIIKDDINKTKIKTKQKKQKNNNKDLLLPFIKDSTTRDKIYDSYSEDRIQKVVNAAINQKPSNPGGFIRWALKNEIIFEKNNSPAISIRDSTLTEDVSLIEERNKLLDEKKAYLEWKTQNRKLYNDISEGFRLKLCESFSNVIQLNIQTEIQTKQHILDNYINIGE